MGMTYTSSCPMGGWGSAQGVSEGEKGVFFRYDTPPFFFWLTAIYLIGGGEGGVFLHKLSDFSFSQKLIFLHPFHPLYPLIASLCNVYQCLTLYFERSENTPFSPPPSSWLQGGSGNHLMVLHATHITPKFFRRPSNRRGGSVRLLPSFILPLRGKGGASCCGASLGVWTLRRKAREGSVVRLTRVATNGLNWDHHLYLGVFH